jgi:pilus assembly protein Flp/PilA
VWREFPSAVGVYRLLMHGEQVLGRRISMKNLVAIVRRLRRRADEGASAVEYGLLVALIAVVIALAVGGLGLVLSNTVKDACNKVANGGSVPAGCSSGDGSGSGS